MAQAPRDGNQVTAKLGSYNGTPVTLKVEHTTGYLKVKVYNTTLSAPSVTPSVAEHDDNGVASAMGTYNGNPKPLLVTHDNGYLRAVITP